MSENKGFLVKEYEVLFTKQWAPWVGGLLLGVVNVLMFAYAKPWGVAIGMNNWGEWVIKLVGLNPRDIATPVQHTVSLTIIGLLIGAAVSALLARQFAFRFTYTRDAVRGVLGGILLGIGSVLGIGCTIGGFFSSFAALSLAGPLMLVGLMVGANLGLRILNWDLAREKTPAPKAAAKEKTIGGVGGVDWFAIQPYIGLGIIVLVAVYFLWDKQTFSTSGIEVTRNMMVLFGVVLGFINQRSRFCFVRAFREPFMTGDGAMTRGAVLALIVGVLGFALIKGTDLNEMRDPLTNVNPSVFLGSLLGGLIFGIGMVLVGGCASGSLWRAGEGQMKYWLVLLVFAVSNALFSRFMAAFNVREKMGDQAYFLPDLAGWGWGILIMLGIAVLWYLLAIWNEEKGKLIMD